MTRWAIVCLVAAALAGCAADSGGACGDVSSDAANCGACGHGCLGGACESGVCRPLALSSVPTGSISETLALDGDSVYWMSSGDTGYQLSKVAKAGGAKVQLATGAGTPYLGRANLAVDDQSAYWISFQPRAVLSASLGGGGAPTLLAPLPDGESGLEAAVAVDAQSIYYKVSFVGVWALAKGSGAPRELAPLGGDSYGGLGLDGGQVYWTELDGGLHAAGTAGGGSTLLLGGRPAPTGALALSGSLYWLEVGAIGRPSSVMTAALDGTSAHPLASGLAVEVDAPLAVDDESVYLLTGLLGDKHVTTLPREGGTPQTMAGYSGFAQGLAADETSLYFTSDDTLYRLAK